MSGTGGTTTTLTTQVFVLWTASTAVRVTGCVPRFKAVPGAGLCASVTGGEQSDACTFVRRLGSNMAWQLGSVTRRRDVGGQFTTGGRVSLTCTAVTHPLLLPQASTTAKVTFVVDRK